VDEGDQVKRGTKIAEWDPYTRPIMTEVDGIVGFEDLIENQSMSEAIDEATGESTTASINSECFRQIEYAGVLKNAKNPEGARALLKFMQSKEFQAAMPDANYVYPADTSVALPDAWARFAPASESFVDVSKLNFDANRSKWQDQWRDIVTGK